MPNFTPTLNLKKPLQTENYDVDVFNGNCDLIDEKIKTMENNKIDNLWKQALLYSIGDVVYSSKKSDSYKIMECTATGTSGSAEPIWGNVGTSISDGTITWKIFDVRQGTSIGRIPTIIDVGGGKAGLPAISGKLLTDISGVSIGTVLPFLANKPQSGWLSVDTGALVSRTAYPDLWSWVQSDGPLISESAWQAQVAVQSSVGFYSSGDGSTTFRLPRIVDFVSGTDIGRTAGTWRPDSIKLHKHAQTWGQGSAGSVGAGNTVSGTSQNTVTNPINYTLETGESETRPKSISMLYCVKAFDAETNQGMIDITALANEMANKVNSSEFLGTNQSKTTNGYQKLPSGLIIQWGNVSVGADVSNVTFPLAFPSNCFSLVSDRYGAMDNTADLSVLSYTSTGFSCNPNAAGTWSYIAIGI